MHKKYSNILIFPANEVTEIELVVRNELSKVHEATNTQRVIRQEY